MPFAILYKRSTNISLLLTNFFKNVLGPGYAYFSRRSGVHKRVKSWVETVHMRTPLNKMESHDDENVSDVSSANAPDTPTSFTNIRKRKIPSMLSSKVRFIFCTKKNQCEAYGHAMLILDHKKEGMKPMGGCNQIRKNFKCTTHVECPKYASITSVLNRSDSK